MRFNKFSFFHFFVFRGSSFLVLLQWFGAMLWNTDNRYDVNYRPFSEHGLFVL